MAKNIKGRKFVATAATAALVASAIVPVASAAEFGDQSKISAWAADAVKHAVEKGYMQGTGGNFNPQGTVTKAQVAQVIYNALGLKAGAPAKFSDVPAGQWYTDAVNALAEKDIVSGTDKGTFEPNKDVTLAEAAQMLSKALEIKGTADLSKFADASVVPTWANEAIQGLVSKGYIKGGEVNGKLSLDPLGNLTRERLATMFVNIAKGELEEGPVTTATKVASVTATNLKQVVVTFDGTVDKETAEDKANYALKSGKTIGAATLLQDGKTVVLTLAGTLNNNKAEAISISNVKAGEKTVSVSNFEFNVFDNAIPAVTEVKTLGTKALKVVFSEPVKDPKQANFTLDGKAYYGKITVVGNEVILTPYTALTTGEHTLQVAKVNDYAGFTSITSTNTFTVVEDKEAPAVDKAEATLETLTLTFTEDVDVDTVSASKVYWKSGDSKKAAYEVEQLAGNKFKFYFKDDKTLPTGTVTMYVEGVKDYSGNSIAADTKLVVTPVIDQTRPEVKTVKVVDAKTLEITFSKNVETNSAQTKGNYTVLDKDGKVIAVKSATANKNVVTLVLYSDLSTGDNKLTIKNVKDNTKLQNTMLDYSETVKKGDTKDPSIDSKVANSSERRVVIGFDEKMDIATLTDYSNYLVKIDNQLRSLTADIATIDVLHDGKVVVITFVEKMGNKNVSFTSSPSSTTTQVSELQILNLKDLSGNVLANFKQNNGTNKVDLTSASTSLQVLETTLVDSDTVQVKFNAGIDAASNGAIHSITGFASQEVESIEVDGTSTIKVNFKKDFKSDASNVNFKVDTTKLETLAGSGSGGDLTITAASVIDKVKPSLVENGIASKTGAANIIEVTFDEVIKDAALGLLASDLEVRVNGTLLSSAKGEFTVATGTANDEKFEITILKNGIVAADDVTVALKDGRYVQDESGNTADSFTAKAIKDGDSVTELIAPTVASAVEKSTTSVAITFSEQLDADSVVLANFTGSATPSAVSLSADGKTVTVTVAAMSGTETIIVGAGVKDLAGNPITATTLTRGTDF